ncbi:vacuolar sorting protein 39 domain 1 [Truncatella angustata]|uniref:Vacuolar sorting protein 39 domain 1 n=1 Tax=Truncatella angustata TaxID=152316 RepID=A0A9P8RJV9_9PEZI|nr:vacuolar sorting protein 39 domain 1 [Truncatella angustata]KAH6639956.1 vacuolar sorting protein 39 domain 1 [Truncatella angustata]
MLSAFTARPIIELKQRDKSKIETILAYGDRVLVGLNTGVLRVYRLNSPSQPNGDGNGNASAPSNAPSDADRPNPNTGSSAKPTVLLREVDKFSTRAIEQLARIKEANLIVSLSAYHVSLYDLSTYELVETLARTKNATCFAVTSNVVKDAATGIPEIISRLAVAVKRKLLLWSWQESELSNEVQEIVLPESVRSVTWSTATHMVCGMNAGYVLVDVETSSITEINGSGAAAAGGQGSRFGAASMGYMGLGGYMPKPLATKLADGEMLLAKDVSSLFIDADGKPLEKRQMPWQSAPDNIGYSYPYILALQPPAKGALDVWNPDTLSLIQNISLPGAAQMHFPPPTVSLAHAGKGFHVSSDRAVWKMDATDYDSQVTELIQQNKYDEAISILGMLEDALLKDKVGTMREIKMRKAEMLFRAKKYRQSMDLFNENDVHAPPERVLRLFPRSISGDLSEEPVQEESVSESEPETQEAEEAEHPEHGSTDDDKPTASAGRGGGFSRYWPLGGGAKKADSDTASIASKKGPSTADKDADTASVKAPKTEPAPVVPKSTTLEGKDLMEAVAELKFFLSGTRPRLQRVLDPETGKLRRQTSGLSDTQTTESSEDPSKGASLDASFLIDTSKLDSEQELEDSIRETFTLVDTTLFRVYMLSQPNLASHLFRIPNFCDPKVVNEKLLQTNRYSELVEFFYGKKLHREALTLLRRFGTADEQDQEKKTGIMNWLKPKRGGTGDKEHENEGIPSQLRGTRRTVLYLQSLPPDLVDLILEFSEWVLRREPDSGMEVFLADSENAETLPRDRVVHFLAGIDEKLELKYLEHIIEELDDATPDFHNRVVDLRVEMLKEMKQDDAARTEASEKLVHFLRESSQYSLGQAHRLIPRDDPVFYEASAIVFSNMGNDKQALEIYVFKMQDYAKAEDYCNRIQKSRQDSSQTSPTTQTEEPLDQDDPDSHPSIYHVLLSLYLTPPKPYQSNLAPALDLLSKHGSRLPASSSLSLVPDDLPVRALESYFSGRIRAANSRLAESRVVEGLRKTLLVDTQALLLLGDGMPGGQGGRNRRVVVGEERICGTCHKRLGNTVVAVLPDNSVVHYGCLNKGSGQRKASISGGRVVAGAWGRAS